MFIFLLKNRLIKALRMTKHSFKARVQSESSPTDFRGTVHVEKPPHAGCFKNPILHFISFAIYNSSTFIFIFLMIV